MGTLFVDTGGSANNSGSTDQNAANLTGTAATAAGTVISLDGSPDLSGLVTSGASQSSIWLTQATNSNRKIFWITAVDNSVLKTVTVDVAPTGITSSAWSIGGRQLYTPASIQGALRAGDTMQFNNSPASSASTLLMAVQPGDSTNGFVRVIGKTGVRPVLELTAANAVVNGNNIALWWIENLELRSTSTQTTTSLTGTAWVFNKVKFSHPSGGGTAIGVSSPAAATKFIGCEWSGWIGDCMTVTVNGVIVTDSYFHDGSANGITHSAAGPFISIVDCLFDTLGGRGIHLSGASTTSGHGCIIWGNTIYNCGTAGLEVADADTSVLLVNNVFQNDGTHANVIWAAGNAELVSFHGYNVFFASGGTNLTGLTANATESTNDPLFVDAANANFAIGNASPAAASGIPGVFLGGPTGFRDRGAVQRQGGGSSGGIVSG